MSSKKVISSFDVTASAYSGQSQYVSGSQILHQNISCYISHWRRFGKIRFSDGEFWISIRAIRWKAPLNKLCAIAWSVWSATRRGSLEVEFHMRSACEWCPSKMIGNGAIIWRNIECKICEGRFIWTGLCLCYVFFSFVHSAATISSAEQNKLFTAVENIYSREFTRLVGTYFAMHCDLFTSTGVGVCDWSTVSRPRRTRTWFSSPKVQILTEFSSLFTHTK